MPECHQQENLLLWQRRLTVGVLVSAVVIELVVFAGYFADILRILGISVLISYLLINVVDYLTGFLRWRALAIAVVYMVLALLTVIGAIIVVPAMTYQVSQLAQQVFNSIPEGLQYLNNLLLPLENRFQAAQIHVRTTDILNSFAAGIPRLEPSLLLSKMSDVAMSTMTWTIYAISIFVVTFYFLLDGRKLVAGMLTWVPAQYRASLHLITVDIDKSLQSFFRGQIVLGILAGIVMLGVYLLLGVQYALLLSVFLAVWEIVPVIGPPIGFLPTIASVAVHGMHFPEHRLLQLLVIILIFQVFQQIKDNVIAPKYIGNVIGVHPIIIFIAIMIGARLDGICGIIFALPVACVLNVIIAHLPLKSSQNTDGTVDFTEPA